MSPMCGFLTDRARARAGAFPCRPAARLLLLWLKVYSLSPGGGYVKHPSLAIQTPAHLPDCHQEKTSESCFCPLFWMENPWEAK